MNRLRVLLLAFFVLLLPSLLLADDATLKICNKASIELDVAVASRVQFLITGYKWDINGWYAVAPGSCTVVYSAEYDGAGPLTPQSGARIAYTVVNSRNQWGAYHSDVVEKGEWIQTGTGSICVKYGEPFRIIKAAGDPAADCDGIALPVADEFLPPEPGNYTLTLAWEGDRFFVPFDVKNAPAPPPASSTPSSSAPVAPPPVQKPEPASPADDPIGDGGFISPPSVFTVLVCVPSNLVTEWNNSSAGSKMVAFKTMAARYITSVAQPSWEYLILGPRYEAFNPSMANEGGLFISSVSPDSGRFDPFNPKCPSGYADSSLKIHH